MKKQILNFGKALNKAEQKTINGGGMIECSYENAIDDCGTGFWCPDSTRRCTPCDVYSANETGCSA